MCVIVCLCVGLATFQAQVPLKSPTSFLLLESLLKLDLGVVTFKEHRDASGFCQARNYWGFVQSQKPCRLLGSPPDKLNTQTGEQVQSCNHICLNATYQKASFKGLSGLVHLLLEKSWGHQVAKLFFFRSVIQVPTSWNFDEFQQHAVLLQQGLVWSSCPIASCPLRVVQLQPTVGLTPCTGK